MTYDRKAKRATWRSKSTGDEGTIDIVRDCDHSKFKQKRGKPAA